MVFDVIEVPIEKLDVDNPVMPSEELYRSVSNLGILHEPIVVRSEEDTNRYRVIVGRRRVLSASAKGERRIKVKWLREEPTADLIAKIILAENFVRNNNPLAEAEAVKTLYDRGWPLTGIAKMVGMSKSRASKLMGLFRLPPELHDAIERGELSMSSAFEIEALPEDAIRRIAQHYIDEGTIPRRVINQELERIKPPQAKRRYENALKQAKRLPKHYLRRLIEELQHELDAE